MPQFAIYPIIFILSIGGAEAVLKWGKANPQSFFNNENYWEFVFGISIFLYVCTTLLF